MKGFEKFQHNYEESVKVIESLLEPSQYQPQMHELVKWMMETDANPYSYLQDGYAHLAETADGFAGLLHIIHHALYDDGDICFVAVNGEPRIIFADKYDDGFRQAVLSRQEQELESPDSFYAKKTGRTFNYEIKVLDIEPNEFGPLYDSYTYERAERLSNRGLL